MSDSQPLHGLQPTRLLHPWDLPGKSTGVGLVQMLLTPEDLHLKVYSDSDLTRFTWNPKGADGDKENTLKRSKRTKRTIVKITF